MGLRIPTTQRHEVLEASGVAPARRAAEQLGIANGLSATRAHEAGLITTELATNLVRHTPAGGTIILTGRDGELTIVALDSGPGISDLSRALSDGYSTVGGSGTGLGAVKRLSDAFDVHSDPHHGSVLSARVHADRRAPAEAAAGLAVPLGGEGPCGDAWTAVPLEDGDMTLLMADGLGHGPAAADASNAAVAALRRAPDEAPTDLLRRVHDALRHTRGAAGAVARLSPRERVLRYAGLGNITGAIVGPVGRTQLASHNGTLGANMHRVQEFTYPLRGDDIVVMHSDGLRTDWNLGAYPGLLRCSPLTVAGALIRDAGRQRDDNGVLVARVDGGLAA